LWPVAPNHRLAAPEPARLVDSHFINSGGREYLVPKDLAGVNWQQEIWRFWWHDTLLRGAAQIEGASWAKKAMLGWWSTTFAAYGNPVHLWFLELLHLFAPLPAAFVIFVIFCFILNGVGAGLLVDRLVGSRPLAVLGGVFFAFNPYFFEMANDGRMRELMAFWIPLALIAVLGLEREGRRGPVLAGILTGLALTTYWYYGIFILMVMGLRVLWVLPGESGAGPNRRLPGRILAAALLAMLVALPGGLAIKAYPESGPEIPETSFFTNFPSLDTILSPPRELQAAQRQMASPPADRNLFNLRRTLDDSRPADYLFDLKSPFAPPTLPVFLALLLAPLAWRRGGAFWLTVMAGFYLLALGPYLKLGLLGGFVNSPQGVRLPFTWAFKLVPFFSRLAHPNRADALVYLALVILMAIGLRELGKRLRMVDWMMAAMAILVGLQVVLQMWFTGHWPLWTAAYPPPPIYRTLAQEADAGIIEVPKIANTDSVQFFQVFHGQRLYRGWSPGALVLEKTPLVERYVSYRPPPGNRFDLFLSSLEKYPAPFPDFDAGEVEVFLRNGYRYIIVHERFCMVGRDAGGSRGYEAIVAVLERSFGKPVMSGREEADLPFRMAVFRLY